MSTDQCPVLFLRAGPSPVLPRSACKFVGCQVLCIWPEACTRLRVITAGAMPVSRGSEGRRRVVVIREETDWSLSCCRFRGGAGRWLASDGRPGRGVARLAGSLRRGGGRPSGRLPLRAAHALRRLHLLLLQVFGALRCPVATLRKAPGPVQADWLRNRAFRRHHRHPVSQPINVFAWKRFSIW